MSQRHRNVFSALLLACVLATPGFAQGHAHGGGMTHEMGGGMSHDIGGSMPAEGGQSAFAAIAEIVKLLESDPKTDWSKVNLEALRQHLIDMDAVALRSRVTATTVPGGARWVVSGTGPTLGAIKRMTAAHTSMMTEDSSIVIARREQADGVTLTVTARDPKNEVRAGKIRALGFIGFMAAGSHHQHHHLMIASGTMAAMHGH